MKKRQGELYIGTSGWAYSHWDGIFYPKDLASKNKLRYFSQHFKTAEINYSFYHLPKSGTYRNWYEETPPGFLFAVKASRFITHIKRLKGVKVAWRTFLGNSLYLEEKLGPILFQFPPNFKANQENTKRLERFLGFITDPQFGKKFTGVKKLPMRFAFEFRHGSWCNEKVYKLLERYKVAWVIADSPKYPRADVVTCNFVYIRMHGSEAMFSSKYAKKELQYLARKIKRWLEQGISVYTYFNNDVMGYAIENTRTIRKMLS